MEFDEYPFSNSHCKSKTQIEIYIIKKDKKNSDLRSNAERTYIERIEDPNKNEKLENTKERTETEKSESNR